MTDVKVTRETSTRRGYDSKSRYTVIVYENKTYVYNVNGVEYKHEVKDKIKVDTTEVGEKRTSSMTKKTPPKLSLKKQEMTS